MKILLVDDEIHALNDLRDCLSELVPGAELFAFCRSDEALAFAKNCQGLDVAFLDINMPVINGIELAKELKAPYPDLNVVFCTAYSDYMSDAICMHASGYVTKPYEKEDIDKELKNLLHPIRKSNPEVYARTFGDFDFFVDGVAVKFPRSKSKEMLAYLIDKRGGLANKKEIAAALFGDEYDDKTQNYFVKIYNDLVKTLSDLGVEYILVKGHNQYGVDVGRFSSDLFDYLNGDPEAVKAYKMEYMSQYEWAVPLN